MKQAITNSLLLRLFQQVTIFAILLTFLTAVLLAAERGSDFAPMRGLLFLGQCAAVILRELILLALILRTTTGNQRWFAAAYIAVALVAWLNLAAAGQRHPQMPELWAAIAPVLAFAIPLLAIAILHWRSTALFAALAVCLAAAAVVSAYIIQDLRQDDGLAIDIPSGPFSESQLIEMLGSAKPQMVLAAFDAIAKQRIPGSPPLVAAANEAMPRLARRLTDTNSQSWLFRAAWASEYLGKAACPGLAKMIAAAEPFPPAAEVVQHARRVCE